mgnify:CR=1 FL=1
MPLISVIVPVYNAQKTLARCLESISNQTFRDLEIIVVNDGSSDDSEKICCQFQDARLRLISQSNQGVSQARNTGIDYAEGKFLCFVDADDYLMSNHIETLYRTIVQEKTDLVVINFYRIDQQGMRKNKAVTMRTSCEIGKCLYEIYTRELLNQPWNKLFVKEKIVEQFDRNFSLGEDLLFNIDYLKRIRRLSIVDECTYVYDLQLGGGLHKKRQTLDEFFYLYQYLYDGIIRQGIEKRRNMDLFLTKHYIRFLKENNYGFQWEKMKRLKKFAKDNHCSRVACSGVMFYLLSSLYCAAERVKR